MIFSQPNASPLITPLLFFVMVFEPDLHLPFTICMYLINDLGYANAKGKSNRTESKTHAKK